MALTFETFYRSDGDFPAPSDEMKFPASVSPDESDCKWVGGTAKQHYDTLVAWRAAANASGDGAPWSAVCMDEARAFWRSLSAKAITGIGNMYGVEVTLPKADKIDQLVAAEALPTSPASIAHYITRLRAAQAHGPALPALEYSPHMTEYVPVVHGAPPAVDPPVIGAAVDAAIPVVPPPAVPWRGSSRRRRKRP